MAYEHTRQKRNVDPAVSSARSRLAVKTRWQPGADITEEQRALTYANAHLYLTEVLKKAPKLTDEQKTRLAELLAPARTAITATQLAELGGRGDVA
jgi:hypothetical protein